MPTEVSSHETNCCVQFLRMSNDQQRPSFLQQGCSSWILGDLITTECQRASLGELPLPAMESHENGREILVVHAHRRDGSRMFVKFRLALRQ